LYDPFGRSDLTLKLPENFDLGHIDLIDVIVRKKGQANLKEDQAHMALLMVDTFILSIWVYQIQKMGSLASRSQARGINTEA
jgi:hypothetical protein